jgi:hypothetical protein
MKINFSFYSLLILVCIVFILSGCFKKGVTPVSTILTTPLPHSMKGYELYSWQADGVWYFTLITGTNRLKTIEEITTYHNIVTEDACVNIRVQGVEELKTLLVRLPKNEYLFWPGPQWIVRTGNQAGIIVLPPKETIDSVNEYCIKIGLILTVSD